MSISGESLSANRIFSTLDTRQRAATIPPDEIVSGFCSVDGDGRSACHWLDQGRERFGVALDSGSDRLRRARRKNRLPHARLVTHCSPAPFD